MGVGPWPWGHLSMAIGFLAGLLAWLTGQPLWWRFIHGAFMPLAWAVSAVHIEPGWFLLAFVLLATVYLGAITGRVPLYLSNAPTAARLAELLGERRVRNVVDLGAGIGGLAVRLARAHPETPITGIENAPLTWLIGRAVTRWHGPNRIHWRYGSLWSVDLGGFDLVYAFLSPEPMPALWEKARAEMAPGSLLVSNSFAVPDIPPCSVIAVDDRRRTRLYCYVMGEVQRSPTAHPNGSRDRADPPAAPLHWGSSSANAGD